MAAAGAPPSMETFDTYFKRADLDHDGRISGAEAVAFFQGSNLPKHMLAQIWVHADQNRTGFLGRAEFYNALKLVTVAQSGRELTPDIVKAALYGPAAAKIPAPKINPVAAPATQMNMMAPPSNLNSMVRLPVQMGNMAPVASQNLGFNAPRDLPTAGPVPMQGVNPGLPGRGAINPELPGKVSVPGAPRPSSNMPNQTSWVGTSMGGSSQIPARGAMPSANQDRLGLAFSGITSAVTPTPQTPSTASMLSSKQQDPVLPSSQPAGPGWKALVPSGNGVSSNSVFGGDIFSATTKAKSDVLVPSFPTSTIPGPATSVSLASGPNNFDKPGQLNSLNIALTSPAGYNQNQQNKQSITQNQFGSMQSTSGFPISNVSAGPLSSTSSQSEQHWPKFTPSDIKKYTAVFVEVDKDRDGKITGEQARNLFLSWRLPREVLKQVWDLSDQDNDSMLSLREFCIALYLMERYRQGRPLPSVLPNSIKFDEVLLQGTGLPSNAYGAPAWQRNPGLSQQGVPGPSPLMPSSGLKPPLPNSVSPNGSTLHPLQQRTGFPLLEKNLVTQSHVGEEQSVIDLQSPKGVGEKVNEVEKHILDSKEKMEFYRTKMQELVLYKSRCDNRLNEITERASADRREVEGLAKKYEEKYKQVGEIASKLAVEEAAFRDLQERKLELQNAITKVEQGGSADGLLQVRADRIQSDLEQLEKALHERCKLHKLDVKQTATIELPFGWQPGIQEGAIDWDEEWDKFEDEGFMLSTDLSVEVENSEMVEHVKSPSIRSDKADEASTGASSSHMASKMDKLFNGGSPRDQIESAFAYNDEGSARIPTSPGRRTLESTSQLFNLANDISPRAKESYSDRGGAESTISGDKYADDHSWGPTFDGNDDVDSVWGFNTKETDFGRSSESTFFGPGEFGLNPVKVDSPSGSSVFGKDKKSPFSDSVPSTPAYNFKKSPFFDSVPSTPAYNFGSSPRFSEGPEDHSFDNFSRFDSFRMEDGGFQPPRETLTRFDSIRSTNDFGHSRGFTFDDADPFGSMGPFRASGSQNSPRRTSDNWNAS